MFVEGPTGIPGVYWGNYFGPFYVEWFGRDKLDNLPCVIQQRLETGGIFFATASNPSQWNLAETVQLQQAIKENIGEDAFFDMESVRHTLSELEPIPGYLEPEKLQPPRRVPNFPFELNKLPNQPIGGQVEETIRYFTSKGFIYKGIENGVLIFFDKRGGITKVTIGTEGKIEYWP